MKLFPLFADLLDRPVLVVGGGEVALRKARALLEAGAQVTVGAPQLCAELEQAVQEGEVVWLPGVFSPDWVREVWLVVAATDQREVNRAVAAAGAARCCWVNVVDDPELSHFQVPAVIDRNPLTVAISSAGAAPMLARRVREQMEAALDPALGPLATLLAQYRAAIQQAYPVLKQRRDFYEQMLDSAVARHLRLGQHQAAERELQTLLAAARQPSRGSIVLLGVGPGDAGSLTLAGLRALNRADLLLVPQEIPGDILALARRDAERVMAPQQLQAWGEILRARAVAGECAVALTLGAGPSPEKCGLLLDDPIEKIVGLAQF